MKRKSDTQEHGNGPCRLVARETGLMDSLRWAITYISLFFFASFTFLIMKESGIRWVMPGGELRRHNHTNSSMVEHLIFRSRDARSKRAILFIFRIFNMPYNEGSDFYEIT